MQRSVYHICGYSQIPQVANDSEDLPKSPQILYSHMHEHIAKNITLQIGTDVSIPIYI